MCRGVCSQGDGNNYAPKVARWDISGAFLGPSWSFVGAVRGSPGPYLEPVEGFNKAQQGFDGAHQVAPNDIVPMALGMMSLGGLFGPLSVPFWAPLETPLGLSGALPGRPWGLGREGPEKAQEGPQGGPNDIIPIAPSMISFGAGRGPKEGLREGTKRLSTGTRRYHIRGFWYDIVGGPFRALL